MGMARRWFHFCFFRKAANLAYLGYLADSGAILCITDLSLDMVQPSRDFEEQSKENLGKNADDRRDTRSPLAKGWAIGSEVVALSLQFALPLFGGFLVDRWAGSSPVATIVGAVLGCVTAVLGFVAFVRRLEGQSQTRQNGIKKTL